MSSATKKWILVGIDGPVAEREYVLLGDTISIGRIEENDIELQHESISRRHAEIHVSESSAKIVDLGSKNGVLVNGKRGEAFDLKNGDKLILGACRFKVVSENIQTETDPSEADTFKRIKTQRASIFQQSLGIRWKEWLQELWKSYPRHFMVGGFVVLAVILLIFLLPSSKKPVEVSTIEKKPETFQPMAEEAPQASAAPEKKITPEDYTVLRRQAESALLYNDAKQAHIVLSKMKEHDPSDLWAQKKLQIVESRLQNLVNTFYESGAREYERKNYYRAISEWRKCMAFAKDFDQEKYQQAKLKMEQAKSEAVNP